ncbi:MAG: ABC transporter substrate-binding protein [Candidatus Thiodiazotropha sp. 6PLUC9]
MADRELLDRIVMGFTRQTITIPTHSPRRFARGKVIKGCCSTPVAGINNAVRKKSRYGLAGKCLVLLFLGLVSILAGAAPPQRVVSLNLCSDQLLLMLADPEQIASVSHLAREETSSFVASRAKEYPANHAQLEEIITLQPDLVLTVPYTNPRLITALQHLGFNLYPLTLGNHLHEITSEIERLAIRLGQKTRGKAVVDEMLQRIASETEHSELNRPSALFYQPRGYTSGTNTLQNEALKLAGWRNSAAENGLQGYGQISLEKVILSQPDILITSAYGKLSNSLAEQILSHPVLFRLMQDQPRLEIPYKYWICPGPMLAEAVSLLREAKKLK